MDAFLVPLTAALLLFAPPKPEWEARPGLSDEELQRLPEWLQPGD
jgi:hypothetical protein